MSFWSKFQFEITVTLSQLDTAVKSGCLNETVLKDEYGKLTQKYPQALEATLSVLCSAKTKLSRLWSFTSIFR